MGPCSQPDRQESRLRWTKPNGPNSSTEARSMAVAASASRAPDGSSCIRITIPGAGGRRSIDRRSKFTVTPSICRWARFAPNHRFATPKPPDATGPFRARKSRTFPEHLFRNHPDRPQPRLHQLRPCRDREFRAPQPKRMPALRIQMHFHGNASLLRPNVVAQRILYAVYIVILILEQERGRRLAGDMTTNIRIQRDTIVGE